LRSYVAQAVGSWSVDACCAVPGNDCHRDNNPPYCVDHTSSSDWLFGLWPGPPQRFEPTGSRPDYQRVYADYWPYWGHSGDLTIGETSGGGGTSGAPGENGACRQGGTYRGTKNEICGGEGNWGATDVEVWYPI